MMAPGRNCIACHSQGGGEGEGPQFTAAGTVMGGLNDRDMCMGTSGVTVEITTGTGSVISLTSNGAGNFFTGNGIATPYQVRLVSGGRERKMIGAKTDTNCMNCHTEYGANGAPGRIVAP